MAKLAQVGLLSAIALLSSLGILQLQAQQFDRLTHTFQESATKTLTQDLEKEAARLTLLQYFPTFGFDNVVADWSFLNFLQYFGDTPVREITGYGLSPAYFEVILDKDPYFLEAYFFLSGSTAFFAQLPEVSVNLMAEKLQLMSPTEPRRSYYIWRYKGIDEVLLLEDRPAAQVSFATAAEWARIDGSDEALRLAELTSEAAQSLAGGNEDPVSQIKLWEMVLTNGFDPATQQLAISQIRALGGDVLLDERGNFIIRLP
jgi:hypothetical protein